MGDGAEAVQPGHDAEVTTLSRTQRRVLRTKAAIEEAFVALVLERGYDRVTVEDIAAKADLAKATFYSHYENKEALMSAVFLRVVAEGAGRATRREAGWTELRGGGIAATYEHAEEMRDLYRVCLKDLRTRTIYQTTVARHAEQDVVDRLKAVGCEPKVPVPMMARAIAGAHVAILEAWLDGEIPGTAQEVATMQRDLLIAGLAWGHNMSAADLGYTAGT
jgi:AcrR family transcriptional regulator